MNRARAPKTSFRIPPDVSEWLKHQAARNVSSMTAELVRLVRDRMAEEDRAQAER